MRNSIRGLLALLLYTLNFIVCGLIVFGFAPLRFLPIPAAQKLARHLYRSIPILWSILSETILQLTSPIVWDIQIDPRIALKESYILLANHQSWFDIIALQKALRGKAPRPIYFMKHALLWVPVMGWACWLLDFPFLNRSRKCDVDLKRMQATYTRYQNEPVTVMNFAEGTRFRPLTHTAQGSPYQHLLKPRAGGLAFAIAAMPHIHAVLDATIIYEQTRSHPRLLWSLLCGHARHVSVHIAYLPVTPDLQGDYNDDLLYRQHLQAWLNALWEKKDRMIES